MNNHCIKELEETLKYENDNVTYGFIEKFNVSIEEARDIFLETKRWLWLCAFSFQKNHKNVFINEDLRIIDQMWHTFILFTNAYKVFCDNFFGKYIHHAPTPYKVKLEFSKKIEEKTDLAFFERHKQEQIELLEYVHDILGETIVRKWFLEYPLRYSTENIKKIYKGVY